MEGNRKPREIEKRINHLIDRYLDIQFVLKTLSNIEYYMFVHDLPLHTEILKKSYLKYLNSAFKSLALPSNQEIIKQNIEISIIYNNLLKKFNADFQQG